MDLARAPRDLAVVSLLFAAFSMSVACGGGSGGKQTSDAGGQPDGRADGGGECLRDRECPADQKCEDRSCVPPDTCDDQTDCPDGVCDKETGDCVECVLDSDCNNANMECRDNSCQLVSQECANVGDPCDKSKKTGENFVCVNTGQQDKGKGQCLKACQSESECVSSAACVQFSQNGSSAQACIPDQCDGPADSGSCSNRGTSDVFDLSSGAKCVSIDDDTDLCVPTGDRKAGETCTAASPVQGLFCQGNGPCTACTGGNACVQNVCRPVCSSGSTCANGTTCIGKSDSGIVAKGAGFCAEKCEAFSRGQCSSQGEGCMPIDNETGYCRPVGEKGYMEKCTPPDSPDPEKAPCGEGMRCVQFQAPDQQAGTKEIARCAPLCNPPAADDDNHRDNDATCGGTGYVRAAYLGSSPSKIDIRVDGNSWVQGLTSGQISDADPNTSGRQYASPDAGTKKVRVLDGTTNNTSPIAKLDTSVVSGEADWWLVAPTAQGLEAWRFDAVEHRASPDSGKSAVRAVHLVPDFAGTMKDGVDVVAVSGGDFSNAEELAVGLKKGGAGDFAEIDSGTYDVHVFKNGATRNASNALATFSDQTFESGKTRTLVVSGTKAAGDSHRLELTALAGRTPPESRRMTCWTNEQDPNPATGLCLEECALSDFGKGRCDGDSNACRPFQGDRVCLPTGGKAVGKSCNTDAFSPCEGGAYCETRGDGSGVCHSLCAGGGSSNSKLTCSNGRSCAAPAGEVGPCRVACSPKSFPDDQRGPNCPSKLKTCFPRSLDMNGDPDVAYCSASGSKSVGSSCGGSGSGFLQQNCTPGAYCANASGTQRRPILGRFRNRSGGSAQCRKSCKLFGKNAGSRCGQGSACGIDPFLAQSTATGVCLDKAQQVSDPSTFTRCGSNNVGKLCGNHSFCIQGQNSALCVQFCDWDTKEGCSGNLTCQPWFQSDGPLFGEFGACRRP